MSGTSNATNWKAPIARAPRTIVDAHHQEVQDLCASRFSALGFSVEQYKYADGVDVIGTLTGTSRPNEIVIVSAHYDTIMGGNGADDNASKPLGNQGIKLSYHLLAGYGQIPYPCDPRPRIQILL